MDATRHRSEERDERERSGAHVGRSPPLAACALGLLLLLTSAGPVRADPGPSPAEPEPAAAEDEEDDLRQRLTEREDKRRPPKVWSTPLAGRPLTLSGEWELGLAGLRRQVIDPELGRPDRLLLEQELEVETFYSFGPPLSLFFQLRPRMEQDLLSNDFEELSDYYVERGEMWIYSEDVAGSNVNLDLGRLNFEDERRWWWDDDLDAVRVAYETETLEIALALARELAPDRSDRGQVDPEHERVLRLIGEVSWDWAPTHALELFGLYHDDHSRTHRPGDELRFEREDASDARLFWLGGRLLGVFDLRSRGILGYWLDTALVVGDEDLLEFEEMPGHRSTVIDLGHHDVRGWALDVGASWILPFSLEPRLFGGYAFGSGDSQPDEGTDHSFRQTGLQANEAGFGGVERFASYGVTLDPELSNLHVLTVGTGISLLRSSSLDLVYHAYWLAEPATFLRDARLDFDLTGEHRRLGQGLDLVLALEEWTHLELELVTSASRAGRAFGDERGTWSYGGLLAVRWAF